MRAALVVLAVGCGGEGGDGTGLSASLYAATVGQQLVFAPVDLPEGPAVSLEAVDAGWELRDGDDWEDGAVRESFAVSADDGLRVDDTLFLPAFFVIGAEEEGAKVTAAGPADVYYGTFDDAATVELADGRWAGTQILAQGFGPIRFTLDATTWDLVTYTPAP